MTREEAIKELRKLEYYGRPFDNSIEECRKAERKTEALLMAIKALEQEQQSEWERDHEVLKAYADGQESMKPCWIPVSERLPEEDCKTYLVCCANGYIASIMYDRYLGWLLDDDIVAWMPLPQPYKGENEE